MHLNGGHVAFRVKIPSPVFVSDSHFFEKALVEEIVYEVSPSTLSQILNGVQCMLVPCPDIAVGLLSVMTVSHNLGRCCITAGSYSIDIAWKGS